MTQDMMLPCPFCDAVPEATYDQVADFRHPKNDCFLSGVGMTISPTDYYKSLAAWNQRLSRTPSPMFGGTIAEQAAALLEWDAKGGWATNQDVRAALRNVANHALDETPKPAIADDVEREPPHGYTKETWAAKQSEVAEFSRRNPYEDEATGIERKRNSEERLRAAANIQCGDVPDQFALVRRGDIINVLHELIRHRAGHELAIEKRKAAALAMPPADEAVVGRLREWALDQATTHHRLAHENPHLRAEHIASSTAYRNLADEIASLPDTSATEKGE